MSAGVTGNGGVTGFRARLPAGFRALAGSRVIGATGVYAIGNMLPQVSALLLVPVLTRYLTPEEFGIFAYTAAISAFVSIAGSLAIHTYILRFYFDCASDGERRRLLGAVFLFVVLHNAAIFGLGFAAGPALMAWAGSSVPARPYLTLALASTALQVTSAVALVYFRVRERPATFVALTGAGAALNFGATLWLLIVADMGLLARYYGSLIADISLAAVCFAVMARVASLTWDTAIVKRALAFSTPLLLSGLCVSITAVADRFLLEHFLPLAAVGIYAVGYSLAFAMSGLTSAVNRALEPVIFRAAADGSLDGAAMRLKRGVVVLFACIGALVIVFAREIVAVVAGAAFQRSSQVLTVLAMAAVLHAVRLPFELYVVAIKRTRVSMVLYVCAALLSLTLNVVLIPWIGVMGAAASNVCVSVFLLIAFAWASERMSAIRWGLPGDLVRIGTAFAAAVAAAMISSGDPWLTAGLKAAATSVAMLGLAYWSIRRGWWEARLGLSSGVGL